MFKMLWI